MPDVSEGEVDESLGTAWRKLGLTLKLAPHDCLQADSITCMQALGGLNLEAMLPPISPCQQGGAQPLKPDTQKALYIFLGAEGLPACWVDSEIR